MTEQRPLPRATALAAVGRCVATTGRFALSDTAFPHLTMVRQMDVETVLARAVSRRGIPIERGTELLDVTPSPDADGPVRATLRSAAGPDGHVGFRSGTAGPDDLWAWLELVGAQPRHKH